MVAVGNNEPLPVESLFFHHRLDNFCHSWSTGLRRQGLPLGAAFERRRPRQLHTHHKTPSSFILEVGRVSSTRAWHPRTCEYATIYLPYRLVAGARKGLAQQTSPISREQEDEHRATYALSFPQDDPQQWQQHNCIEKNARSCTARLERNSRAAQLGRLLPRFGRPMR